MFDGDADRIGFVSPTGRVIGGDIITAIISKHLLQKTKKTDPIIMYDLTCSRIVPKIIEQY
jgi:phosphomannomutase